MLQLYVTKAKDLKASAILLRRELPYIFPIVTNVIEYLMVEESHIYCVDVKCVIIFTAQGNEKAVTDMKKKTLLT